MPMNPLLQEWTTPFGTPPFGEIEVFHFKPAIIEAIESARREVEEITRNPAEPSFENTIAALETAGAHLSRITPVLYNLNSAETNKALQEATQEISPMLARFSNDITLNTRLFERISSVYENKDSAELTIEQQILVERKYRNFMLGGAGLKDEERARFREISEELSKLSLTFEENVLEETNSWELHITNEADLAGLPEGIVELARSEASKKNREGWIFTLHYPSYIPFMQYSERRELREKMLRAYSSRAFRQNEHDNRENVLRIAALRLELAGMLGFGNYAEMILGDRMADTPEKVESFLGELFSASKPAAYRDLENLREFARSKGFTGAIQRWDWPYWAEKLKKEKYEIDDEILKPYFPLEKAEEAVLGLATSLFGITFARNNEIPGYHREVNAFEVYDRDGTLLSILYLDYHPRPGKNGGAWMTSYRDQSMTNGKDIRPFISIVTNFTRPSQTRPSLLTFGELTTFLHEFGHALHGMLTRCTYESLSGTSVARDFVELPSQFMENFAYEKEWLDSWARHYKTGEKLPGELMEKIKESAVFNEGYSCHRQLSFAFLDMAWHSIKEPAGSDVVAFESEAMSKTELFPPLEGACMSTQFAHIFGGGYAAGYYGYKWAEVLDADAFGLFLEQGIFNTETSASFRRNILEKGGSEKPQYLYRQFRGRDPEMTAFLKRSGLV
jgi:peptidyl-dipeptidase Dcp